MAWAAVGGAAVSVIGGLLGGKKQKKAQQQAMAAADPFGSQRGMYQGDLRNMMHGGFSPNDPSYQWRFNQGEQAVERSQAAGGFLNSGNAATALMGFGQGMASQEYQAQYARLSHLAGADIGSPGTAGQIMANQNTSNQNAQTAGLGMLGNLAGNVISGWGSGGGGGSPVDMTGFQQPVNAGTQFFSAAAAPDTSSTMLASGSGLSGIGGPNSWMA